MSDKQLTQEMRLLKRLVISQNDLSHTQWYANLILSKNLHHSNLDENNYLHRALNTALIVSYWRPFSNNYESVNKDKLKKLTEKFLSDFTRDEKNFHNQIGMLRNKEVAHSEAGRHQVKVNVVNFSDAPLAIPISRNAYIPLDQPETEMLCGMIQKLLRNISQEQIRIQEQLSIGDYF